MLSILALFLLPPAGDPATVTNLGVSVTDLAVGDHFVAYSVGPSGGAEIGLYLRDPAQASTQPLEGLGGLLRFNGDVLFLIGAPAQGGWTRIDAATGETSRYDDSINWYHWYEDHGWSVLSGGFFQPIVVDPEGEKRDLGLIADVLSFEEGGLWLGVSEWRYGDLNGDGDERDVSMIRYDVRDGSVFDPQLALDVVANPFYTTNLMPFSSGDWIGLHVSELAQGQTDLSGDGQVSSSAGFARNTRTGEEFELGIATGRWAMGRYLAFSTWPAESLRLADGDTGEILDTGLEGSVLLAVDEGAVGWTVDQSEVWMLRSDTLDIVELPDYGGGDVITGESHCMYATRESGIDLNGDGDAEDNVLYVVDLISGEHGPLPFAGVPKSPSLGVSPFKVDQDDRPAGVLAFRVSEASQGDTDLNGDGDTADQLLYLYLEADGSVLATGLPVFAPVHRSSGHAYTTAPESFFGEDLTGDGDQDDLDVLFEIELPRSAL